MDAATLTIEKFRPSLIELGAHKVPHLDESLIDHLARTFRILRIFNCAEHVCLAGLFHGAYGTAGLHTDKIEAIPEETRQFVIESIGEKAEQIVFNFSIMSYKSLGKSFRNLLKGDGDPELTDRRNEDPILISKECFHELLTLKLADVIAHSPKHENHSCINLPIEYESFWELVAEYLGEDYKNIWNKFVHG